jgi:hypothetical protein
MTPRIPKLKLICVRCNAAFETHKKTKLYCCVNCSKLAKEKLQRSTTDYKQALLEQKPRHTCDNCRKSFKGNHGTKFCSGNCARLMRDKTIRAKLGALKMASGCVDCGYANHPVALDFDHIIGTKLFDPSRSPTLSAALDEIKKCEVVCANCHRIRTYERHMALKATNDNIPE